MTIDDELALWVRGLTFFPLIVCSIAALALILSKWLDLRARRIITPDAIETALRLLGAGEPRRALAATRGDKAHASRLVATLIAYRGQSRDAIMARGAHTGHEIIREMEHGLGGLALIAVLGPLFGLLGTVVGIVVVFSVLATAEGAASPQELAGGIGTALYTTIAGLLVGILALVAHRAIGARTERISGRLEAIALDVIDRLTGETPPDPDVTRDGTPAATSDETRREPVAGEAR